MKQYIDWIRDALLAIDAKYFLLETMYSPEGIVRERIFCYELYHQMRLIQVERWETLSIILHGEPDKRGHKAFTKRDQVNPDFIFHKPGSFEGDTIVIEVKGNLDRDGIIKDFRTLLTFIKKYNYKLGVFIIFGYSLEDFFKTMQADLLSLTSEMGHEIVGKIFIIALKKAHGSCEVEYLSALQQ